MRSCLPYRFVVVCLAVGIGLLGAGSLAEPPPSRGSTLGASSGPSGAEEPGRDAVVPNEAVQWLQEDVADVRVSVDAETGFASFVGFGPGGHVAGRQAGPLSREAQALELLRLVGDALGINDPDAQLRVGSETRNVNGSQIELQQVYHTFPVIDGGVSVYFNSNLRPIAVDSSFRTGIDVDPAPSLSAAAAQNLASLSADTPLGKDKEGAPLAIYRAADGLDYLVYRFSIDDRREVFVDAHSGNPVGRATRNVTQETKFETRIVENVGGTAVNVGLSNSYNDPVVVCTATYQANTVPVVTRVSLPSGGPPHSSFNVRLQNPGDNDPVAAETVTCLVMSSGSHVIDGHKVEAQSYVSTVTDRKGNWPGQSQAYLQSYANPVVIGQVMSENDAEWSVFWDKGGSRTLPPSPAALTTGKTVAEDDSIVREDETVGFIVFEADHGMIGGVEFEAFVGAKTVSGVDNGAPFSYDFDTAFSAAPDVAIHSMAGVGGGDGGWSQSFASSPWTTATTLQLSIDEDQIGDPERSHVTESAAYVVFSSEVVYPFEPPSGCPFGTNSECDDGLFCNGAETCNVDACEPGPLPCTGLEVCEEGLDACVTGPTLRIETGVVSTPVGSDWTTVELVHNYASPVVVCNVQYLNNGTPVVVRVHNVTSDSFDVRLQSPDGNAVQPETVFYMVVEEGTWLVDGIAFEAHKYLSTVTDAKNLWVGSSRTYDHAYVSPVVIGQVMSQNDPDFSVYWQQGSSRYNPPDSGALKNGKTVLEDPDRTRADETIGYVVFEAVHASLLGVEMEAATGLDSVGSAVSGAPFSYILNQEFPATPMVVLTSMAGVDGGDGGWSQSHGMTVGTASTLNLSVDEDTIGDPERSHTLEQVSYVAFAMPLTFPDDPEPTCVVDADCPGFDDFCDGPDTCFNGACIKGEPPCGPGEACTSLGGGGGVCVPPAAKLETISLTGVDDINDLTSVPFQNAPYDNAVVVCSLQYANNTSPVVVRVDDVTATGFDVWLQNPGDMSPVVADNVNCLVVEEGVWEIDGVMVEAQKYTSSLTDRERNWLGVAKSLNHPFVNPVVLGQVMSANDSRWSTYWQQGNARTSPPTNGFLRNGKAVMEDPDIERLDETVGFIVFEEGHGVLAGVNFEARLGEDIVARVTNGPPFTYSFAVPFDTTPGFAVVSQAGMDGSDGSWAYLFGASPLTPTTIDVAVDEDQLFNLERGHTTEQVGYVVFEEPASFSAVTPPGTLTAGQNVNIVAGSNWPGGDPFLQRQNEPSGAVSSRSVMNLLVGANDYRTVDIPGLPDGKETGDAWLGVFKSFDGGNTWKSNLVPGYPQDASVQGQASPLFGYDAGADAVVRAGAHGLFLYSGIVFDRGPDAESATFVARYLDLNNDPSGDSIRYIDTVLVDSDPGGAGTEGFIDKTWLAVDVPRQGLDPAAFPFETVTLDVPQSGGNKVAQQITCGNSYLTLSRIGGGGTSSEIFITRSTDCGETWSTPQRISSECAISQGSTIAIDPRNGEVHVAWRQFPGNPAKDAEGGTCPPGTPPSAILATKSTDGGQTFAPPVIVANIDPFDQPPNLAEGFLSFRSNAFPTMTVDDTGRAYLAWTGRGLAPDADPVLGDSRIVVSTLSSAKTTWSTPQVVDEPGVRGHQIQPSLTFARGKLALAYYDFREDLSNAFSSFVFDLDGAPGSPTPDPVHTVDVRAAIADPSDNPLFTINNVTPGVPSTRASKYQFYLAGEDETAAELVQVDDNTTNYPLFVGGGVPFIGDYIEIFTQTMSANADGSWTFKAGAVPSAQQWHVVWADNRDVVKPPDGDWTNYKPPLSAENNPAGGGQSLFDPSQTVPICNPADAQDVQRTGMRNQNIYTAVLTQGLFSGSPSSSKPLGTIPGNPDLFQRSFVVWVQNTTDAPKSFRLTVVNQPIGGEASFDQFELVETFEVSTGPDSGVARTVYVTSTETQAAINVDIQEIDAAGGVVEGGLFNTVVLNPDPIAPDPADPSLAQEEIFNLAILNLAILNPAILNDSPEALAILNLAILNPAILNLAILNPADPNLAILNPAILNLAILNLAILNPAILNLAILNPADPNLAILNLAILNPAILNLAILNGAMTEVNYEVENQGNSTAAYDFRAALNGRDGPAKDGEPDDLSYSLMVFKNYSTPGVGENCELGEEIVQELLVNVVNPDLTPGAIEEPDASFFLAPGEKAFITLRVLDADTTIGEPFDPDELEVAIESQSVNTEDLPDGQPPFALPPPSGVVTPATLAAGMGQTITIFGDPFPADLADLAVEFSQSPAVPGIIIPVASTLDALYVRLPDSLTPGLAEVKVIDTASGEGLTGAFITITETPAAPNLLNLLEASDNPCTAAFTASIPDSLIPGSFILVPAQGIDLTGAEFVFTAGGSGTAVPSTCTVADPAFGLAAVVQVPSLAPGTIEIQLTTTVDGIVSPLSNSLFIDNFCGNGSIDLDLGETCDPPGTNAGQPDACRISCTFCGDGELDPGEECDDADNLDGNGCGANCNLEFCGDGIVQNISAGGTASFPVDPRETYLFTNNDPGTALAVGIDLIDAGFAPGDLIRLERIGAYQDSPTGDDVQTSMSAVFSSNSTLNPDGTLLERVPGAINAGLNFTTAPNASSSFQSTDISEDFGVFGSDDLEGATVIVVPAGATHLFVSANDISLGDTADANGDFAIEITLLTGEACDDGNAVDGDGCETDCSPTGGLLELQADDFEEVAIGFDFPFCGTDYSTVFVGSNGHLSFGAGYMFPLDFAGNFLQQLPVIGGLATNLDPTSGGSIIVSQPSPTEFEVRFVDVGEGAFAKSAGGSDKNDKAIGANNFTFLLRMDGSYDVSYGAISATFGVAGRSPGSIFVDPGETDLDIATPSPIPFRTAYESFNGDIDLAFETTEWAACPAFEIARPGVLYGATDDGFGHFLSIDPSTGEGTIIGATGFSNGVYGLAINSGGEIYATQEYFEGLNRIDAATGNATEVATLSASGLDALAFDENDVLYGRRNNGQLVTIDTSNGNVANVGSAQADEIVGLAFDTAGVLFGSGAEDDLDEIFTIADTTGVATSLGVTGRGGSTPGIAFLDGVLYGLKPAAFSDTELITIAPAMPPTGTLVDAIGTGNVASLATRTPSCGDARIDPGEQCDDGNTVDGDGCDSNPDATLADCVLTGLTLGDDDAVQVPIPFFEFPFCGVAYDSVYVGSNGYLTFGAPDTTANADSGALLSGPPRIAGLWLDLKPDQGGQILAGPVGDTFIVSYTNVPDSLGALNSFSITLRPDGSIDLDYGLVDTFEGLLVGRSVGGGALDPGETDLSGETQPIGGGLTTVYEFFDGPTSDGLDETGFEFVGCFHPASSGVCYASTGRADGGRLLVLDAFAPSATVVGATGVDGMPGLAINSKGEIFGTDRDIGHLYRVDAQTGLAALAAEIGFEAPRMRGIAFDGSDVLYGVSFDNKLRTIDIDAGSTSIIGNVFEPMIGLAFDPSDGLLYGTDTNDWLYTIDKVSSAADEIDQTSFSGPTPDLCFLGNTLFASKGGGSSPSNSIITIDKTTGVGSLVGTIPISSISGMASRQSCGDGIIVLGETCETPGQPSGEPDECRPNLCTFCGDGVVNHDEACDDGNNVDLDGCQADCQLISWLASPVLSTCAGPVEEPDTLWFEPEFNDLGAWSSVSLPNEDWSGASTDRFYRGTFFADTAGQAFSLTHQSDDGIQVYINGNLVAEYRACHESGCVNGKPEWLCGEDLVTPALDLSPWVVAGKNVIGVHVTNFGGTGRFDAQFGPEEVLSLNLGDSGNVEVSLPFSFPLCGASHDSVFVNADGSLTFGEGDFFDFQTLSQFLEGPPRIAALWGDLNQAAGGTISVTGSPTAVEVQFDQVADFFGAATNTFTIRLFPDGTSEVEYGALGAPSGIAGRTTGLNAADPGEIDLGVVPGLIGMGENTVYEWFDGGDADLAGRTLTYAACALKTALPGVCYGSTGYNDTVPGRLIRVDLGTGAGTEVGRTGLAAAPALAINSAGEMFATDIEDLYRIDAESGDRVRIGPLNDGIEGIAFDDLGTLYGVSFEDFQIKIINPLTAEITDIPGALDPIGYTVGLAFDPASDTLFGSSNSSDPDAIYTFDRVTGNPTTLGTTGLPGNTTPDLCAVDGVLYGTIGGGMSTGRLVTIDTDTGAGSDVGSIGFTAVSGMASRVPSCGDGRIDTILDEECDDGNAATGDGCESCIITPIPLPLADDDFVEVALPFSFPFCGVAYDSVFVGSNGYVTFGEGDTDPTPSAAELVSGPPRIAGLWTDLNPAQGGTVTVDPGTFASPEAQITFTGVPESGTNNTASFTITLSGDGTTRIDFFGVNSVDNGVVGRSTGGGAADPGETDLDGAPLPLGAGEVTIYELFAGGGDALDLGGLGERQFVGCWNPATPGVCYATRGRNGEELLTIDVTTATATVVANTGFTDGLPGLAINSHGEIFATARDDGALHRIDAVTGLVRRIGATGTASGGFGLFSGIAFDENGVLWGNTSDGSLLQTIDTATGATSTVGPTIGTGFDHLAGLAFDPTDGTLYGSTTSGSQYSPFNDGVLTVDTTTGLAKLIGPTGLRGTQLMDGMGNTINLGQRITDLCFVDGELYGAKGGGSQVDNPLIHIDTSTPGGFILAYANDFEGSPAVYPGVSATLNGEWTTAPVPAGFEGLGAISGIFLHNATGTLNPPKTATELVLDNLPAHDALRLNLTFAAINTWTGRGFRVQVDGETVFESAFDNANEFNQLYDPPTGVQLTPRPFTDLGSPLGGGPAADGVYDLSREILTASLVDPNPLFPSVIRVEHSASTATIEFAAPFATFQGDVDESWAIDGLRVELVSQPTGSVIGLIGYSSISGMATRFPSCGDGHLDSEIGEICDDGNTTGGDGCAADCMTP